MIRPATDPAAEPFYEPHAHVPLSNLASAGTSW